jgi:hypothetical protein
MFSRGSRGRGKFGNWKEYSTNSTLFEKTKPIPHQFWKRADSQNGQTRISRTGDDNYDRSKIGTELLQSAKMARK